MRVSASTGKSLPWAPLGVLALLYVYIFVVSLWMPLAGDDFGYSIYLGMMSADAQGQITSFRQILEQTGIYYFDLNGRFVPNFLISASLFLGKAAADHLVSICLVAICYLSFLHATGRNPRTLADAGKIALFFFGMWIWSADLATPFIWKTGALNYSLSLALTLLFLLPFRRYWIDGETAQEWPRSLTGSIALALIGATAALCIENLSLGVSLFLFLSLIVALCGKRALPAWYFIGTVGFFAGTALLIIAPGNWVRLGTVGEEPHVLRQIVLFIRHVGLDMWPLWICGALLWWQSAGVSADARAGFRRVFLFYGCLGIFVAAALLPFPVFPTRAIIATSAFLLIALISGLRPDMFPGLGPTVAKATAILIVLGVTFLGGAEAVKIALSHRALSGEWEKFTTELVRQRDAGQSRLEIEAMPVLNNREIFTPQFHDATRVPFFKYFAVSDVRLHQDHFMSLFGSATKLTMQGDALHLDTGPLVLSEIRHTPFDADSDIAFFVFHAEGDVCFPDAYPWLDVRGTTDGDALLDRVVVQLAPAAAKALVLPRHGLYAVPYREGNVIVVPGLFPRTTSVGHLVLSIPAREPDENCPADMVRLFP